MTTRPCRWPDGGCGQPVAFIPTGRTKPNGDPVWQVIDPEPAPDGNIVIRDGLAVVITASRPALPGEVLLVDHHVTCAKWRAMVERKRAASKIRAGRERDPARPTF